jgi:hypothetical protein
VIARRQKIPQLQLQKLICTIMQQQPSSMQNSMLLLIAIGRL